ncbi:AEC family transporter [Pullulanibacillus sp. KACC 23026]|uniref:AEC family transporter n=1 Tax=Pullulanibacillus sp. KACC 23026 TaxID=3028315 RepID=UPI0023B1AB54|nr:AEC family transporter [Pullulanibacillus sp. KACC 23026]WEG11898.1 AEC family transporter [Pullulanibacillus sp. KACC 23026]
MSNFIFSLNIAMPIFIVMALGYFLKRIGMLNATFIKVSNKLVFTVALPIKLFSDIMNTHINSYFDGRFILYTVIGTFLTMVLAWGLGLVLIKDKRQIGAYVQGAFRGNFVYVGITLMENMTGTIGLKTPLVIAFVVPLYNVLTVILLTLTNQEKRSEFSLKKTAMDAIKTIVQNPMIIAIVAGIIASEIGLKLPVMLSRSIDQVSPIATPLALITIGATFNFQGSIKKLLPTVYASVLKLIIFPLAAVMLATAWGFSTQDVLLIYVLFGVPTSTTSYIMTAAMDGDSELSSNIIMMTTLLSVFSMTAFIFVFKTIGLIG